jgi:hypothetical protein
LSFEFVCFLLKLGNQIFLGSAVVEVGDVAGGVTVDAVVVAACVRAEC